MKILALLVLCRTSALRLQPAAVNFGHADRVTRPLQPCQMAASSSFKPLPPTLIEWGMDEELWSKVENKRNLMKLVNRGDEKNGRLRIEKLRQILKEEDEAARAPALATGSVGAAPMEGEGDAEGVEGDPDGDFMEVVCPGLSADRLLRLQLPDGREFDVSVPPDVEVGDTFLVGPFPRLTAEEGGLAAEPLVEEPSTLEDSVEIPLVSYEDDDELDLPPYEASPDNFFDEPILKLPMGPRP